jgi:hypothetical protein
MTENCLWALPLWLPTRANTLAPDNRNWPLSGQLNGTP